MKLLIDIGNTRIKWVVSHDNQFVDHGAVVHDGAPARAIAALPNRPDAKVWIAHVTGADHEVDLIQAARTHFGRAPHFARSGKTWHGLRNVYREPERLGVDRWLAMIAAWHQYHGAACIASAGTALTVDVIAANGHHVGGIIAAGLVPQQRAVRGTTRFEVRATLDEGGDILGTDTESCVRQGAILACLGAIDRAANLAEAGATRLLTGGDAGTLHAGLGNIWQHRPHLVLEGLGIYADASSDGAA